MKAIFFLICCLATPIFVTAQEVSKSINNSLIAFTVPEKDLIPENIAYDIKTETFYIGSTRKAKVIKIDKNGNQSDFIASRTEGLLMIIGMKVDTKNRWLWICSSGGENLIDYNLKDDVDGRPSGIFKFNLDTGELIKKYVLEAKGEVHFFNDLVIDTKGNVYITHMFNEHSIFTIQKEKDILELFLKPSELKYPNGIAITNDDRFLFIAHSDGLARIEIKSKHYIKIQNPKAIKVSKKESLDGLYFYNNSIIGIQPDIKTVQKFVLNEDLDTLINSKLLEVNHPMMNNPTTGVLHANTLYYIANAQFGSFDDKGNLLPMNKLYEPTVLKLKLDE